MAGTALSITWPCTHCDVQVPLPVSVKSSGETIRDEAGKAIGVTLTPEVTPRRSEGSTR